MTTTSWSSRLRHDSDATYQEWRDELITKLGVLVTAGVLAADETNITPGAGARPGTSTEGGYAVYHLSDSLHGTAPIYIRFGFGTDTSTTRPRLQSIVGTSTNGSGTLGGTALSVAGNMGNTQVQTTDTARASYLCAVAGFMGLYWKTDAAGGTGGYDGMFAVCRTVDSDGAPTATGALIVRGAGSLTVTTTQAFRYAATAAAYTQQSVNANTALGISPQTPSASTVGSDIQVAVGWTITPRVAPLVGVCGVYPADVPSGSTLSATLVGTTARTYLRLGNLAGPFGPVGVTATGGMAYAMLWE